MTLRTVALYAFAAASVLAACCGCSITSEESRLTPASAQTHQGRSLLRPAAIPASIIVGYRGRSSGTIFVYQLDESGRWTYRAKIDNVSIPAAMRTGSLDDPEPLFAADFGRGDVKEFGLVNGKFIRALKVEVGEPYQLAADVLNDVAILSVSRPGDYRVTIYPYGYGYTPIVISKGLVYPTFALFDDGRDLFVADRNSNKVVEYAPASDQVISTITNGVDQPVALAIDSNGLLWVANAGANNVTGYQNGRLVQVLNTGDRSPTAVLTHEDHVFVAAAAKEGGRDAVIDYDRGGTGSHVEITDGVVEPHSLGYCPPDLCVLNTDSVTVYASDKLIQTIRGYPLMLSLTTTR